MQRIIGFMALLHEARRAGRPGVPAADLIRLAGWEDAGDPISAVNRDLNHLRGQGWRIENISEPGLPAVFRMTAVDNRLKLRLSPGQQAALLRAVLLADRADLGERLDLPAAAVPGVPTAAVASEDDPTLNTVIAAVRSAARLRFRYNGTSRTVHPESLRTQQTKWYLRGHEDGSDVLKSFVVSRMSEVYADAPGSATPLAVEPGQRPGLHPLSWEVDSPADVTLRTPAAYVPDVVRWLGAPASTSTEGDDELLTYRVTHRAAMRSRIHQLGTRVRVVGPDDFRAELLDELATMAGE
jgi:predicted DNA-binding transcriptional regulator YafY